MNLIYDNIIFSLQRFGGISVVWRELLRRASADSNLRITALEYPTSTLQSNNGLLRNNQRVAMSTRRLERYRQPNWKVKDNSLFHSSYFRILDAPNVVNITTIHDLTYHYYRSGLAKHVHLWQEANAIQHSAGIVCVSQSTKDDLLRHYPKLNNENVFVVYNGVNETFRSCDTDNPTPFEHQGYLLYVGNRQAVYKKFNVAVIVAQQVHMPLVIVGSELLPNEQNMLNATLGVDQYFVLSNPNQEQLNSVYNHAYCLLYPSAYEGFGLPILEAQRTGCLVIGQDISSVPEVMGEGGICVPASPDDQVLVNEIVNAIGEIKSGRINEQQLRNIGLENSQRFSWDTNYVQMMQVYQTIQTKLP